MNSHQLLVGSRKAIRLKYATAEFAVTNSGWLQIGHKCFCQIKIRIKSPTVDCGGTLGVRQKEAGEHPSSRDTSLSPAKFRSTSTLSILLT